MVNEEAEKPNGKITRIELFRNSALVGSFSGNPQLILFTLSNMSVDYYELTARVLDDKGASVISSPVQIVIENPNRVPQIQIVFHKNGDVFLEGTDIQIEADAIDPEGEIRKVEFYIGCILLDVSTSPLFLSILPKAPIGIYNLTAKSFDDHGAKSVSSVVNIIEKSLEVLPEVNLVTPDNGQVFQEGDKVSFSVLFSGNFNAVKKVEFYS